LESAERVRYRPQPRAQSVQDVFLEGVEAGRNPEFHGKPWDQVAYLLAEHYHGWYDDAFRRGFEQAQ